MADIKISSDKLVEEIKNILKGADLTQLSSKAIRKTLEAQLKADLTDRKKEIDDLVMDMITQSTSQENNNNSSEDSDEESESPRPKKRIKKELKDVKQSASNDSGSDSDLIQESNHGSYSDSDGLHIDTETTRSKKKSSKRMKSNDTKDSDEALAKQLQEEESFLPRRSAFIKASSKKKGTQKVKKEGKGPSNSTYSRPCTLSADLAEVVGAPELPRHSVVKKMWEVARERNLFDPTNKRYIICDDQLFKMFGTKRILMFGIMKYLKTHIKDQKNLTK